MNNKNKHTDLLMMIKCVKKGERIYPNQSKTPIAVAEENFLVNDIGEIDYSITYPILHKNNLLLLPGLKKNINIKRRSKCKKRKKKE